MAPAEFTQLEQQILAGSATPDVTVRRRRVVIITALLLVAAILYAATTPLSRTVFVVAFAAYVLITLIEKIAYANAVLAYKSVIRKLLSNSHKPGAPADQGW
jgi:hypothetical protein